MRLRKVTVLVAALFVPLCAAAAAERDCLFVEAAMLERGWPPAFASEISPSDLSSVHRIARGSGTVALLRTFTGKKGQELDSEEYWKLTIAVPNVAPGEARTLLANANNTRFSRGGSAWTDKGFGYVGILVNGNVWLKRLNAELMHIEASLDIETRFAGDPEEVQSVAVRRSLNLRRTEHAGLTPWLGSIDVGWADYWVGHRPEALAPSCFDEK